MNPFNIKITVQNTALTLTILPDQDYFKVIYYGGILGAVRYNENTKNWNLVPEEEVIAGDLPPYSNDLDENRVEVSLDSKTILKIGAQIVESDFLNST